MGKEMEKRARGLSLRVRGTLLPSGDEPADVRIIPAPAGNTRRCRWRLWRWPDHPRACGEHVYRLHWQSRQGGSSPRLRGTPHFDRVDAREVRIIPAPAGNTGCMMTYSIPAADHPRACGEHTVTVIAHAGDYGSSPRLRGTLHIIGTLFRNERIIPAPAGNTSSSPPASAPKPDHPRACGEHTARSFVRLLMRGSSPRLRGTLDDAVGYGVFGRIIPAPAGNTSWGPM